jgi:hypothetical protein
MKSLRRTYTATGFIITHNGDSTSRVYIQGSKCAPVSTYHIIIAPMERRCYSATGFTPASVSHAGEAGSILCPLGNQIHKSQEQTSHRDPHPPRKSIKTMGLYVRNKFLAFMYLVAWTQNASSFTCMRYTCGSKPSGRVASSLHRCNNKMICRDRCTFTSLNVHSTRRIAIVGGGLAGLSVAFHLLTQTKERQAHSHQFEITIIDKAPPGQGGASAVAGG